MKRRRQLTESVVEAEGKHGKKAIARRVLKVLRDAVCAGHHVSMRQHHAFRFSGAARSVQNRRYIDVDHAMRSFCVARREQRFPLMNFETMSRGYLCVSNKYDMLEIGAVREDVSKAGKTFFRCHQHADVAVAQNVFHL